MTASREARNHAIMSRLCPRLTHLWTKTQRRSVHWFGDLFSTISPSTSEEKKLLRARNSINQREGKLKIILRRINPPHWKSRKKTSSTDYARQNENPRETRRRKKFCASPEHFLYFFFAFSEALAEKKTREGEDERGGRRRKVGRRGNEMYFVMARWYEVLNICMM